MEERENPIELKSEPMNEMLSHPPGWITRSGSGLILLVLCIFGCFTWFMRYPDEINGDVVITSSKPPIELSNQGYIQLKRLHVTENQQVNSGDLIAQFDLQVKAKDIEQATAYLDELEGFNFDTRIFEFRSELQLGIYQEQWKNLLAKIHEWNMEQAENSVGRELAFIQREISFREQLQVISGRKVRLSESESAWMEEQLAGSERLAEQHVVSKQSLSQDKRAWNQANQAVQNQKEQAIQNLIALNSLRKERERLKHDARMNKLQKASGIRIQLSALRNSFQNWEKNAAWMAPCSGKILFNQLLQVNRFYKANEASIIVVPEGSGYLAVASVRSSGAGKVKIGQKAMIELVDYPNTEFGMLEGKVKSITQMDKEGKYEVQISLPAKLKTTYDKEIPPKAQLKGKVKIITKNKRLVMRFFEQLIALMG